MYQATAIGLISLPDRQFSIITSATNINEIILLSYFTKINNTIRHRMTMHPAEVLYQLYSQELTAINLQENEEIRIVKRKELDDFFLAQILSLQELAAAVVLSKTKREDIIQLPITSCMKSFLFDESAKQL